MATLMIINASVYAQDAAQKEETMSSPKWEIFYDFTEHLKDPGVENPFRVNSVLQTLSGRPRVSLFQHTQPLHLPQARLSFTQLTLPTLAENERLTLLFNPGIKTGFDTSQPPFDGVRFIIEVNGQQLYSQDLNQQIWLDGSVDLTPYAGQMINLAFVTHPVENPASDWALWGSPRIEIEGRPATISSVPAIAHTPSLKIQSMLASEKPNRIGIVYETSLSTVLTLALDENLDLPIQLARESGRANQQVPFAPAMVIGEGADPQNHTVVQILNRYGLADVQFLAYSPDVMGGVQVCAAQAITTDSQGINLVTAPISAENTREIRIFNRYGGFIKAFEPDPKLVETPFVIATGNFLPEHFGDEIAVVSLMPNEAPLSNNTIPIAFYDLSGTLKEVVEIPASAAENIKLHMTRAVAPDGDHLLVQLGKTVIELVAGHIGPTREYSEIPDGWNVFPSYQGELLATGAEPLYSTLLKLEPNYEKIDVGRRENMFWYVFFGAPADNGLPSDTEHIKRADYDHLRTDIRAQNLISHENYALDQDAFLKMFESPQGFAQYNRERPVMYEPCFTHRQPHDYFVKNWMPYKDDAGHAMYPMLTRNNNPVDYGEFDTVGFMASTYAYGLPALDAYYTKTLELFLKQLAVEFRKRPSQLASLEPNHEHEIAVEADGSMGDYNTKNIEGFFRYLVRLYGADPERLNALMGTSFDEYFDAPRQKERGDWDLYVDTNPFHVNWIRYNRHVVNRRIADTFREALLAGFPPEIIRSHQIPDLYAIGNLSAFSEITSRITPIDYTMAAGVGFGYTRYGVWYKGGRDVLHAAKTSGFDAITIGEYQALTPDANDAFEQLKHLFENGVDTLNCMWWPEGYDNGFNATMTEALKRLLAEDKPRPGFTGGVTQVRPHFDKDGRKFNLVSIGVGPEHTGLIKSVTDTGEWDGCVYTVPFHAGILIEEIARHDHVKLGAYGFRTPIGDLDSGVQIEFQFKARAATPERMQVCLFSDDSPLPGTTQAFDVGTEWKNYRIILRVQLPADPITMGLSAQTSPGDIEIADFHAIRHTAKIAKPTKGVFYGERHRGGVMFDVIPE